LFKNKCIIERKREVSGPLARDAGFSLLEVALALMVIGMIVAPLLATYNAEITRDRLNDTRGKLAKIESSINQHFYAGNGYYPCPASLIIGEGNTEHGIGGDCSVLGNLTLCTDNSWKTGAGLCVTSYDPLDAVVIGAVPFGDLNISQMDTIDVWGNKILYAVTYMQTDPATFQDHIGAIDLIGLDPADNNNTKDIVPPVFIESPADFFLVSLGETGDGAYTKDGVLVSNCMNNLNSNDFENCDFDSRFMNDHHPENRDFSGARSAIPGPRFYDDITRFQTSVPESIWFPHADFTDHIVTMATDVGIGTPDPQETLDVVGNIRVDGNLKSDLICNSDEGACFDPELITGTRPEMLCNEVSGGFKGAASVADNRLKCNSAVRLDGLPTDPNGVVFVVPTGPSANDFDVNDCSQTGELLQGFAPNGDPICALPTP